MPLHILKSIGFVICPVYGAKEGHGIYELIAINLFIRIRTELIYSLFILKLFYGDLKATERAQ